MSSLRGLYVHVPFCVSKCTYCDFYSLAGRDEAKTAYVAAVLNEAAATSGQSFQTLYLGGGTPSVLGAGLLERMVSGLRNSLDLSGLLEASIEVNPDSASRDLLVTARATGFARLSVGIQSLADDELRSVGRVHTAAQAIETVRLARSLGFTSISADLIVGLPGQRWPSLRHSLERLVEVGIDHVSLYCLSVEDGTALRADVPPNLPSEDAQAELFDLARFVLAHSGFSHYEISNFARPGHECLHNLIYWHGDEYLGLGPAAASHTDGKRFRNRPDLDKYILTPGPHTEQIECLDAEQKASEEAMLRLRLLGEGLDIAALAARFGPANVSELETRLDKLAQDGSLECEGTTFRLPPARVLTSNPILAEVVARPR